MRSDNLSRHHNNGCCKIRCQTCGVRVPWETFDEHKNTHIFNLNVSNSASSSTGCTPISTNEEEDPDLQDIYSTFSKYIKSRTKIGQIMDQFNFKLEVFSKNEIIFQFKKIFRQQKTAFKVNISMGFILQNKVTKEYRFFWSSQNNQLFFSKPTLIRNSEDKKSFIDEINNTDLVEKIIRPNSQWTFVKVTNITFYVYRLVGVPIGSPLELPGYLLKNKGLFSLVNNVNTGKRYNDQKCLFRCLAIHQGATLKGLERKSNKLLKVFCHKAGITKFSGVTLDQLEVISRIFNTPINVYQQEDNRKTNFLLRSTLQEGKVLNLNLYSDPDGEIEHFSYINDLDIYSQNYRCPKCDKIWERSGNFHRHVRTCEVGVKKMYYNGTFKLKPSIFEELEKIGVDVPENLRIYPYMATFDIECMLMKDMDVEDTKKVEYTARHELVSISVCSNVPNYQEPKCFVLTKEGHQKKLVKEMVDYLLEISDQAASLLREEFEPYSDKISSSFLEEQFESYLSQMPVLSFNGSSYDLKVLKQYLIPLFVELDSLKFIIKKGTGYMVIATEELKFLDIMNYISPGFNYDTFLKAYGALTTKSYFPYEYLDSFEKLNSKAFPPYESFYSSLKSSNTLEPIGATELIKSEQQIIGRAPSKKEPVNKLESKVIGESRYNGLKEQFQKKGWSIKDYLVYYNNLDVKPFIQALDNLKTYYADRGVDVFKQAVSG